MENLILLVHLLTALIIIGLIMLQQGRGAEMGASFGSGASQTLFGATGTGNFFARMTALFVAIFFATSITLAIIAKHKGAASVDVNLPTLEKVDAPKADTESDLPKVSGDKAADAASTGSDSDLPKVSTDAASDSAPAQASGNADSGLPETPKADGDKPDSK